MKKSRRKWKSGKLPPGTDYRTRSRLLEAAGIVFSEKGYDRATAREICEMAQANPAAVNYHFGGKEPLYVEVLREAHRRLVNLGVLQSTLKDMGVAEENLDKFLGSLLHSMLDPSRSGWMAKLMLREMTVPTKAFEEVVELQIRPTSVLVRKLIGRFMDLPPDHPSVIRGTLSTVAQFMFLFQNRRVIKMVFPDLDLTPERIDDLARHIVKFTIAGLRATARDLGRSEGK